MENNRDLHSCRTKNFPLLLNALTSTTMLRGVFRALPTIPMRFMSAGLLVRRTFVMPQFVKPQEFAIIHEKLPVTIGTITREIQENQKVLDAFGDLTEEVDRTMYLDSVLRKRRLKMKKHKLRKRRREQRALKKRLGKL